MLILGLRGITAEVIKNIALAGVKSIVIVDEGNLTEADLHSNLFATYDKLGQDVILVLLLLLCFNDSYNIVTRLFIEIPKRIGNKLTLLY